MSQPCAILRTMSDDPRSAPPSGPSDPLRLRDRVLAEAERFRARFPELLKVHADKWIVFRDDEVVSVHDTEEEAYLAGLGRFGPDGGHVVMQVREQEVAVLSGSALLFGS